MKAAIFRRRKNHHQQRHSRFGNRPCRQTRKPQCRERGRLGSINNQNKLIVNKVRDYRLSQPTLSSPDIDWTEFLNDFDSRTFIQNLMMRLDGLLQSLENAKILYDWDNYQAALIDYDHAKYKAGTQALGYETNLEKNKQSFSRTDISGGNEMTPLTPED
ncbi:MAG: hypothetical protein IPL35_07225 [Sphingobacteriales bacterium]|nr:hypothetical protein [Sphingobacteriales bacterium]